MPGDFVFIFSSGLRLQNACKRYLDQSVSEPAEGCQAFISSFFFRAARCAALKKKGEAGPYSLRQAQGPESKKQKPVLFIPSAGSGTGK